MRTRIKYAKKAHFFRGDGHITIVDAKGLWRTKADLHGSADVRALVRDKEKLHRSRQYRVMMALGFQCKDIYGMVYDAGAVRVVFYNSKVKELLVDGKPVETATIEVRHAPD